MLRDLTAQMYQFKIKVLKSNKVYFIMKNLLESYQNKLKSINELIESNKNNGSINDIKRAERFETKKSEYRSFIVDIEREIKYEKERKQEKFNEAIKVFKGTNTTEINPVDVYNALKIALELD